MKSALVYSLVYTLFTAVPIEGVSQGVENEDIYLFCETCEKDGDFLVKATNAAASDGIHDVIVFNLKSSTVKAYTLEKMTAKDSDIVTKNISPKEVPQEAFNAIKLYQDVLEKNLN